jgi:pSer/pThr/pTyr-binding forkhead associated (FHA) protein
VRLAVLSGPHVGRVIPLHGPVAIGRSPANALVLDDPNVSRRHATVTPREDGAVEVADDGSLNGTWVNGRRIAGARPLRPGDRVRIGGSELLLTASARDDSGFTRPGLRLVPEADAPTRS